MSSSECVKPKIPAFLLDSVAVRRLRDDDEIPLYGPAEKHLSRRAAHSPGDLTHTVVREMPAAVERAVGLERHVALLARVEQLPPVLAGARVSICGRASASPSYAEPAHYGWPAEPRLTAPSGSSGGTPSRVRRGSAAAN